MTTTQSSLEKQVALVTGGSQGIGLGCAQRFAAEGCKVVIAARTQANIDLAVAEKADQDNRRVAELADNGVKPVRLVYQDGGKTIKAAATADRNGFFYVLDRTNGKFIRGFPFVDKITWAKGLDKNGRPIYDDSNRPGAPGGETKGKSVFAAPAFLGAKNWMPMAYSQDTGLFYVPSNEWGMDIWNEDIAYKKGAAYLGSGFTIKPLNEDYIGVLRAIDPKTGKEVWRHKNFAPLWGGVMTTKGNLVFTGTPEGYLQAFNAKTGDKVWEFQTGSGVLGSPVTWEMDGEQYVSVLSGWGGAVPLWGGEVAKRVKDFNQGGMLWTFKLPKELVTKR